MKIIVGSFQQESNTLSSRLSSSEDFSIFRGEEMLDQISVTSFFIKEGVSIVPTLYAHALPGGRLERGSYDEISTELIELIKVAKEEVDGVWLYLHGALYVDGLGSGELDLVKRIRKIVGNNIPIALALDFHANNTDELMKHVNIIAGYRTAPHRDMEETEIRAAELLVYCIRNSLLPKPQSVRVPVVVPGDCVLTDEEPLRSIMNKASQLEQADGMMVCNVFNGQPWVDAPYMGPTMVCIHEDSPEQAKNAARELACMFFNARHKFSFNIEAFETEQALKKACASGDKPVFVTDSGDNTTAGAAGDNAYLLDLILRMELQNVLVAGITDSAAVEYCYTVRPGMEIEVEVGGSLEISSVKTNIKGVLVRTGDVEGWYGENAGRSAVIRVGEVDVVLTENRCAFIKPRIFYGLGLDPYDYKFVVVKLGYLYPELSDIAKRTILAFTKGTSTERLQDMGFTKIKRPVYPLDDDFEFEISI